MGERVSLDLVALIDQGYRTRSWHGPNLCGALRGVTPETAAWRPSPQRHNIWELAVHAAYWKYRVCRLLAAQPPAAFDLAGSDWFARPVETTAAAWKADLALLDAWHERLRQAVAALDPARLDEHPGRSEHTFWGLVTGIAAHDVYHAGQIRLLRRMREATG